MTIGMVGLVATAYAQAAAPVQQESIFRMVTGSGPVVQGVLYILLLASVFSWAVIFYKFRQIRRARSQSERFIEIFWETKNLTAIHGATEELKYSSVGQVF